MLKHMLIKILAEVLVSVLRLMQVHPQVLLLRQVQKRMPRLDGTDLMLRLKLELLLKQRLKYL